MDPQCVIKTNADVSGLGVRISLYMQTCLTIALVAFSPESAKPAWWTMTTTAMGLAIASFAAGAQRIISLLDAVIVSYLLVLPLIATASATARLPRVVSPLLIIIDTVRFLLTSTFGLWIWASAPRFGINPECNPTIKFVIFGKGISATSVAARAIGLVFWASYLAFFLISSTLRADTLLLSILAPFSGPAADAFRRPRRSEDADKVILSSTRVDLEVTIGFRTPFGFQYLLHKRRWATTIPETKYPIRDFHSPPSSLFPRELKDSTVGRLIQRIILTVVVSSVVFVMVMVELELSVGNEGIILDASFGFSQILPLALTIVPLLSFLDWWYQSIAMDDVSQRQSVLLTIEQARNFPHRSNCFTVISINDSDEIYATWTQPRTGNPIWNESFVISICELSNVLVRVFDCGPDGSPRSLGHAVLNILHSPGNTDIHKGRHTVDLKCEGSFGGPSLDYVISTNAQRPPVAVDPSTLMPRGKSRRYTQYLTFEAVPLISLASIAYRIETTSQTFSRRILTSPAPAPSTLHDQRAYAIWATSPNRAYGCSLEVSPTRLPEPERGNGPNFSDIQQLWVPGPVKRSGLNLRLLGQWVRVVFPWIIISRSPAGFAISSTGPFLVDLGMALTEPLPPS